MALTRKEEIEELIELRRKASLGGGEERIENLKKKGKLSVRERITKLLDPGSFHEIQGFRMTRIHEFGMQKKAILGDGCVTGYGTIDGRMVFVFAHDATVFGGSLGEAFGEKIAELMDQAAKVGAPIIGLNDSGGARIQEGVASLYAYAKIFNRNVRASGVVPQISVILGACAGGAVYSPALTDFIFMVENTSQMMITGPQVIKAVTGEEIGMEALGGASVHTTKTGVAHFSAPTEKEVFRMVRELVSYLPSNNADEAPLSPQTDSPDRQDKELNKIVGASEKSYDMIEVLERIFDKGTLFQAGSNHAPNIITAFARLFGKSVGIIANNPQAMAGTLDVNASNKAARFIRFCNAFSIPVITFVDTPGYLPGVQQEHTGIIKHGSKLLYAYGEATVPLVTVITRKAYGGAYVAMCSPPNADVVYAWPSAEIAVMGAQGAANIIYRREIMSSPNPDKVRQERIEEYSQKFDNPYQAAHLGLVSEVIVPSETRPRLISALTMLQNKRTEPIPRKHGLAPL